MITFGKFTFLHHLRCNCGPDFRLIQISLQGKKDLVLRDISRWAGELPWEGVGEFLQSRMAFHISSPFLIAFITTDFIMWSDIWNVSYIELRIHNLYCWFTLSIGFWMMQTGREMLKIPGFGKQSEFLGCIERAIIRDQSDWNSMNLVVDSVFSSEVRV